MRVLDRLAPTVAMRLLVSSGENGPCSPEIVRTNRQKTVKRRNFGGIKLEYYHLPAGGTVSLHNGPLMVASRLSTPLGKSDRPIQDELLTVNCESEAERFRGENRLCKRIPLSPFTAQLVQLCQRAKRAAK